MKKKNAVFMTSGAREAVEKAYSPAVRASLFEKLNFFDDIYGKEHIDARADELRETEFIFSTWGMPALTGEELGLYLPALKAVFYAAGSVQEFARPFLSDGIRVFSAFGANAVPVAEYTVSQILLAGKGFFLCQNAVKSKGYAAARALAEEYPGNYGGKIGIIGAGAIGKLVIGRLKGGAGITGGPDILVFDPFLSDLQAYAMGVEKCTLERLFSECPVISNHLANNAQTRGLLDYQLFSRMGPYASFINTGRGAQVVEADLIRALKEEPGRCALLDVTDPEPPEQGHPFYSMDNVFLTPHIAGSMGNEVARMGAYMLEALNSYLSGNPSPHEVTFSMLNTMA